MPRLDQTAFRRVLSETGMSLPAAAKRARIDIDILRLASNGGIIKSIDLAKLANMFSSRLNRPISPQELTGDDPKLSLADQITTSPPARPKKGETILPAGNVTFSGSGFISGSVASIPPPVPAQTRSANFTIEEGVVQAIPSQSFSEDANDYRRLSALHEPLLEAVREAEQELSKGNRPFDFLLGSLEKYRKLIDQDLKDINYAKLYAYGLRLDTALQRTRDLIESGELPDFDLKAIVAVESVWQLHGPFILSTGDGRDLITDAERYSRSPQEERQFQDDVHTFGRLLADRKDIVESQTIDFIEDITQKDDRSENFERRYVFARGAAKNLVIVMAGGAVLATISSIPIVGPYLSQSLGLIGIEAVKKSKGFQDTINPAAASLDKIHQQRLDKLSRVPQSQLEKIRDFVVSNQKLMRQVGGRASEMAWFRDAMDWVLQGNASPVASIDIGENPYDIDVLPHASSYPIFIGRMSLKLLKRLPGQAYIASGIESDDEPVLVASLAEETAEEIYERVKSLRLQGRKFYCYADEESFKRLHNDRISWDFVGSVAGYDVS